MVSHAFFGLFKYNYTFLFFVRYVKIKRIADKAVDKHIKGKSKCNKQVFLNAWMND